MEKRKAKAKVLRYDKLSGRGALQVEGIHKEVWFNKSNLTWSRISEDDIYKDIVLDVEVEEKEPNKWRVSKMWLIDSKSSSNLKTDSKFPSHSLSNENFYLKLFKQKKLFDDKYEFDKKFHTTFQKSEFDEKLIAKINQNNIENAKSLLGEARVKTDLVFTPEWRLILGLGGSSIYETGMTLHHIYGIPYLPSSAVKGIARSYAITEIYKNEVEALSRKDFCDIFGCNGEGKIGEVRYKSYYKLNPIDKNDTGDRQGKVIFFDAYPQKTIHLEADIMNPHYSPYYSDTKGQVPPADWHNPVPIPFLTVGNKTSFQFAIGVKKDDDKNLLGTAFEWLTNALKEHGIGAKTAVGYGYMQ